MRSYNVNTQGEQTWFTPPEIFKPLGKFDLDPCTHELRPWDIAEKSYTKEDDGLLMPWFGRVWMNPPYGRGMEHWIEKLALHGDGTAFVFNRSDINAFHYYVFPFADSILFLKGRVNFYDINGVRGDNAPAPNILIAYGENNSDALAASGLKGHHQSMNPGVYIIGINRAKTWRVLIGDVLSEFHDGAELQEIYERVVELAPDRIRRNRNYKAKIRQQLQYFYTKVQNKWCHD